MIFLTISSKNLIFFSVFWLWISWWWILHNAIKSDQSGLFFLFHLKHLEIWLISVAIFWQSGISQNIVSDLDLWRDFNQSFWYLSILFIGFYKLKGVFYNIILKCIDQFFGVYMICISQTNPQRLNKRSSKIFKCFWKFRSIKRNGI